MKKHEFSIEDNKGFLNQEPLYDSEKTKPKRSKLFRWLRSVIEFIFDLFT
jgi:hypothetical protein